MKQFFSRITQDHWTAKNRLEKAAHKVATEMDRRIISEDQVSAFIEEIRTKIHDINYENRRCKPLELTIWQPEIYCGETKGLDMNYDIFFNIPSVFHLQLFKAKSN